MDDVLLEKLFGFCYARTYQISVNKGGIYGLIGGNGAGKTTVLRLICGLAKRIFTHLIQCQCLYLMDKIYAAGGRGGDFQVFRENNLSSMPEASQHWKKDVPGKRGTAPDRGTCSPVL